MQFSISLTVSLSLSLAHRISGLPLNTFSLSLFAYWGSCPHSVNWQKDRKREHSLRKQIPADLLVQTPCRISHSRCICNGIAPRLSEVHPKVTVVSMHYFLVYRLDRINTISFASWVTLWTVQLLEPSSSRSFIIIKMQRETRHLHWDSRELSQWSHRQWFYFLSFYSPWCHFFLLFIFQTHPKKKKNEIPTNHLYLNVA